MGFLKTMLYKGEGGWMSYFFKTLKPTQELSQKWVAAVSFGMAVAFMMFIKELRRNGDETTDTAENRHLPPNFFLPFLAELDIFESFEAIIFFAQKNYSNILLFNQ